jgi:hypothetical protein
MNNIRRRRPLGPLKPSTTPPKWNHAKARALWRKEAISAVHFPSRHVPVVELEVKRAVKPKCVVKPAAWCAKSDMPANTPSGINPHRPDARPQSIRPTGCSSFITPVLDAAAEGSGVMKLLQSVQVPIGEARAKTPSASNQCRLDADQEGYCMMPKHRKHLKRPLAATVSVRLFWMPRQKDQGW